MDEINDLFKELQMGLQKNLDTGIGDGLAKASVSPQCFCFFLQHDCLSSKYDSTCATPTCVVLGPNSHVCASSHHHTTHCRIHILSHEPQNVDLAFTQLVETKADNLDLCLDDVAAMTEDLRDAVREGDQITHEDEIVMDDVMHHNSGIVRRDSVGMKQQEMVKRMQSQ